MVTRLCNLRCGFCRIWEMDAKGEMTAEEWIRVLERSPRFLWIDLTGGEPTLRPDLREIIAAAIRIHRPWALHFPTNGFLPDRVAPLLEHGRRTRLVVTVSIDGPPALHDRMRGVEGSFERALETLQRARQAPGVTAKAGMTITSENESASGSRTSPARNSTSTSPRSPGTSTATPKRVSPRRRGFRGMLNRQPRQRRGSGRPPGWPPPGSKIATARFCRTFSTRDDALSPAPR
jgi:hypothetical protein